MLFKIDQTGTTPESGGTSSKYWNVFPLSHKQAYEGVASVNKEYCKVVYLLKLLSKL